MPKRTPSMPGVFAMSITPFNRNGALDESALRQHLQFLSSRGAGVYLASHGTGEGPLLSRDELRRVYEIGVEELKGKTPVYAAGAAHPDTRTVIQRVTDAAATGIDAVYLYGPKTGPGTTRPNNDEIDGFFDDVLGSVKAKFWLANNTTVTGYELPLDVVRRLFTQYPEKLIGICSAHTEMGYHASLIAAVGPRVPVYVAMMPNLPGTLALGGRGIIAPDPNVAPRLCSTAHALFQSGQGSKALAEFARVLRLGAVLGKYRNPRAQKAALNLMGMPGGYPRRPNLAVDEAGMKEIAKTLKELDIKRSEGLA
jgi:4-hydroxy-tetrahydrodipicolinate synthase